MSRTKSARERIYGPPAYRDFLNAIGCEICGATPIEIAHVRTGGMGRKADWTATIPLCPTHHREQHQIGTKSFQARYGVSLTDRAAQIQQAWEAFASTGRSGHAGEASPRPRS